MLSLRQLAKTYAGGVVGLHPTDLTVEPGEHLALLGPSGSGKSTLLRLVVGLEQVSSGEVWRGGVRIDRLPPHRRGVALLPQRPALYPQMTIAENLHVVGKSASIADAVDLLRLVELLPRRPHQLSGGEKQRVALAKLFLRGADFWLLDEPFAGLYPQFRAEFRHDLHLFIARAGATILLVTHDPIDALALGRRIGVLDGGRLQQVGPADELLARPGHRIVAFSLGQFCFVNGTAASGTVVGGGDPPAATFVSDCGSIRVPVPPDLVRRLPTGSTTRLTLGLRPDDVSAWAPAQGPPTLCGWPLVSAEPVGSGWLLTVARGRTRVRAEWRAGSPPALGTPTDWIIRPDRGTWFDGDSGCRL